MNTSAHLRRAAGLLDTDASLDVIAALYQGATWILPDAFRTDSDAAIELTKSSAWAMASIRAVYDTLGAEVTMPDQDGPDEVIDRVSHWAETAPDTQSQPPTRTEVIGRLLRTADALDQQAHTHAA
ncbi:hypothetical protein ABT039_22420 [Streptomyces lasiicapitis]|uniref:hypothetical protein n=1 Tax=Streptomyces lasiicapitis TaxID=1923961 RepID=UPI003327C8FB